MTGRIPERPIHHGFTDRLWELTQWCLKPEPSDRPRVEQVLEALKDMGGSGRVSLDRVGVQSPQTVKGDTNKTFSRESIHTRSLCQKYSILVSHQHPSAQSKCWWGDLSCLFAAEIILINWQESNRLKVILEKCSTLAVN